MKCEPTEPFKGKDSKAVFPHDKEVLEKRRSINSKSMG